MISKVLHGAGVMCVYVAIVVVVPPAVMAYVLIRLAAEYEVPS